MDRTVIRRMSQAELFGEPFVREAKATWPAATLVVVNYNGGEQLAACLESLYADPAMTDYELLIVDNASIDGSADAAAAHFPQANVVLSAHNLGFGGANNLAVEQARGEILVFLNPDTIVEPGWVGPLLDVLENEPEVGLVTSQIRLIDDPGRINTAGNDVHITGLTLCRGMWQPISTMTSPADVAAVSGAAFAIRRQLFESLGGFDASFFMYLEDTDLSLRARLAGYRCRYVPESVIHHDYTLHFGPNKVYHEEHNRYRMLLKTFSWPTLLLLLPTLLLGELVTWGYVLLRDRPRWNNKVRAYADVVRNWSTIRHQRRQIQRTRCADDRELLRLTTHRLAFEQTGDGFVTRAAHFLFDPLFFLARYLILFMVRW